MIDVLIDTDVMIDHLHGRSSFDLARHEPAYSILTRAELFAAEDAQEDAIRIFLEPFEELGVDRAIVERAGRLRRQGLYLPDAVIAATALEHKLTLVTRNRRDFEGVRGLRVRSPA